MRRTYGVFGARAGLVALVAMLVLFGLPATAMAQEVPGERGATLGNGSVLLAPGAGYADPETSEEVRALQQALRKLGWRPGKVDGLFGPRTTNAVVGLQEAAGIEPDGIVGPRTVRALEAALGSPPRRGMGYEQPDGSPQVRSLQGTLQRLGLNPGPVDGVFGPRTQAAVKRLQRAGGVPADGIVGPPTRRLLAEGGSALDEEAARTRSAPQEAPDRARRGRNEGSQTRSNSGTGPRIRKPVDTPPDQATDTPDPTGDTDLLPVIGIALLAAVLAALLGTMLGRRGSRTGPMSVPPGHGLIAEGRSRVGRYRGPVRGVAFARRGLVRRPEARYLVSDPNQPNPFWVREDEVAKLVPATPEQSQAPQPEEAPPLDAAPQQDQQAEAPPLDAAPQQDQQAAAPQQDQPAAAPQPDEPDQAREPDQAAVPPTPQTPTTDGVRALGYVSIAGTEAPNGNQPKAQMEAIDSLCERRGWRLLEVVRDREEPRGTALDRPGLEYALERLRRGEASCLIVSDLRRLGRSVADLGRVLEVIGRNGGRLVALDLRIDTSTPEGRKAANVLATVGGWERQRLAERTRRGLEAARAKGASTRPSVGDVPALKNWIVELRESGLTLQAIADRLNAEGVPTLRGGAKWRPSSVQAAVGYRRPAREAGALANGESGNGESRNGESATEEAANGRRLE
jgi:peptidoglycan hydrolase-like protein with peptidoglycan-binding domain/DNA invertase Pin-like site-specific DNA recombinase